MITFEILKETETPICCEVVKTHSEPTKYDTMHNYAYDLKIVIDGAVSIITLSKEDIKYLAFYNKIYFKNYRYNKAEQFIAKPKNNYAYINRIKDVRDSLISAYNASIINFKKKNTVRYTNDTVAVASNYSNRIDINNAATGENIGNIYIEELAIHNRYWLIIKMANESKNIYTDISNNGRFNEFYIGKHRISISNIVEHMIIESIKKLDS